MVSGSRSDCDSRHSTRCRSQSGSRSRRASHRSSGSRSQALICATYHPCHHPPNPMEIVASCIVFGTSKSASILHQLLYFLFCENRSTLLQDISNKILENILTQSSCRSRNRYTVDELLNEYTKNPWSCQNDGKGPRVKETEGQN